MHTEKSQAVFLKKYLPGNTGLQAVEHFMVFDEQIIFFKVLRDFFMDCTVRGKDTVRIKQSEVIAEQCRRNTSDFIQNNCTAGKIPWVKPVEQCRAAGAACHVYKFKCRRAE